MHLAFNLKMITMIATFSNLPSNIHMALHICFFTCPKDVCVCVCLCYVTILYVYIYNFFKQVTRTSRGRDFDDSLERCNECLSPRSWSKDQHSARNLLVHSAPSTAPKHSPSPVLNRASLRER